MTFLDTAFIIPLIMMGRIYWNTLGWISDHFLLWACVVCLAKYCSQIFLLFHLIGCPSQIHATFDLGLYLTRMCVEIRDFLGIRVFSMVPVPKGSGPNAPPSGQHPPLRRSIPSRINVKDGSGRVPLSPQSSRNTGGSSTLSR